MQAHLNNTHYN